MTRRAHVAILMPRYLDLILAGEKDIECRLSRTRRAPFEQVSPGDTIHLKQSGAGYRARAIVTHATFIMIDRARDLIELRRDYNARIKAPASYWRDKRGARFASLLTLGSVTPTKIGPEIPRQHGRAWIVLPCARARRAA